MDLLEELSLFLEGNGYLKTPRTTVDLKYKLSQVCLVFGRQHKNCACWQCYLSKKNLRISGKAELSSRYGSLQMLQCREYAAVASNRFA